jgi:hypothetical protein
MAVVGGNNFSEDKKCQQGPKGRHLPRRRSALTLEINSGDSDKRQIRPPIRKSAPHEQDSNCQTGTNVWSWAPRRSSTPRQSDWLTDWPSVTMSLWLWLGESIKTKVWRVGGLCEMAPRLRFSWSNQWVVKATPATKDVKKTEVEENRYHATTSELTAY